MLSCNRSQHTEVGCAVGRHHDYNSELTHLKFKRNVLSAASRCCGNKIPRAQSEIIALKYWIMRPAVWRGKHGLQSSWAGKTFSLFTQPAFSSTADISTMCWIYHVTMQITWTYVLDWCMKNNSTVIQLANQVGSSYRTLSPFPRAKSWGGDKSRQFQIQWNPVVPFSNTGHTLVPSCEQLRVIEVFDTLFRLLLIFLKINKHSIH